MERIEEFLRGFCAALAAGKMYPVSHPQFRKVVDTTYEHLEFVLKEKGELTIGLIEGEIVYENRVLFKLSKILELLLIHAKKKGIEKIYFYSAVQKDELIHFVSFLLSAEETSGNIEQQLQRAGVEHIKASQLTTPDQEKKKDENELSPYENALKDLALFYEKLAATPADQAAMQQHLKLIMLSVKDKLIGKYRDHLSLKLLNEYDDNVVRCLNVSILSVTVVSKLGFTSDEVLATGSAGLLYNIGTAGKGPLESAKILLKYKAVFGTLPVIVAFEHGQIQGPPEKKAAVSYSAQPHIVSMIIALCESYDDLLRRQNATGQTQEIHRRLEKDNSAWLPPQLLDRFVKILK